MLMDSATSPSASRRMTGGGRHTAKIESFGLDNPTEMKAFAMSNDFLMMLCVLVRIVAMCIDCGLMLIGFLMIPVFDKEHKQLIL